MFGSVAPTVPPSTQEGQGQPAPAKIVDNRRPCPSQWAQTGPVRIVSMQDSNAATSATGGAGACNTCGACCRQESGTDRTTTTTRVSSSAVAIPLPPLFSHFFLPHMVPWYCESICDRRTLANAFFVFPDTRCPLACRYHDTAKVPISRLAPRTPARPELQNTHSILPMAYLCSHA
ncbi:hypothetical protein BGY98DRAFT_324600 [Russula aff. rugulosa BPL654]|jgi:hypothetical protein|nr:hypothetical protein BGY98DRAFT_324600 [Russula aff. rugulosa BPL654]